MQLESSVFRWLKRFARRAGGSDDLVNDAPRAAPDYPVPRQRSDGLPPAPPRIIVVANEKGGVGKSTLAALIAIALLYRGRSVAVIDLDLRQQSFSHFLANRRKWLTAADVSAPSPLEYKLAEDPAVLAGAEPARVVSLFERAMELAYAGAEIVVVDTPGADTPLARAAHLQADLVVTPINDSFVDFDLLCRIDPANLKVIRPGLYSRMIAATRQTRARHGRTLDWVVLRNRMAGDARNRERLSEKLQEIAPQVGFRLGPSMRERVAYREMFPFGLTIADLAADLRAADISPPRKAALEELDELIAALLYGPKVTSPMPNRRPIHQG